MTWTYRPTRPGIVRQCLGKEALEEWQARGKAKRLTATKGIKMGTYQCPLCSKWHVTKKPAR